MVCTKTDPRIVLGAMRPYGDLLVCGISTQRHAFVDGFDETLSPGDPDFSAAGLAALRRTKLPRRTLPHVAPPRFQTA